MKAAATPLLQVTAENRHIFFFFYRPNCLEHPQTVKNKHDRRPILVSYTNSNNKGIFLILGSKLALKHFNGDATLNREADLVII